MTPFDLTGRVALVTGANTGIGQAIALALAAAGADVALAGRTPAAETAAGVRALGRRAAIIDADLSSAEPVAEVVDNAAAAFGALDILVNNAGTIRRADAVDFSEADWDAVIDTNLKSLFFLCQAAGRHMLDLGGGKIVNIASFELPGRHPMSPPTPRRRAPSPASPSCWQRMRGKGVTERDAAPELIATNNTATLQADETRNRQILERIPAGRWGAPSDIGGAAVFLASAASDYVNGHILAVDGGWLAR